MRMIKEIIFIKNHCFHLCVLLFYINSELPLSVCYSLRTQKPFAARCAYTSPAKLHAPSSCGVSYIKVGQGRPCPAGSGRRAGAPQLDAAACFLDLVLKAVDVHWAADDLRLFALTPASWSRRAGNPAGKYCPWCQRCGRCAPAPARWSDRPPCSRREGQHKAVGNRRCRTDVHLFASHLLRVLSGQDAQKARIVDADIQ